METCQFGHNWKASGIRMVNGMLGPLDGSFQGASFGLDSRVQVDSIKFVHPEASG